MNISPDTIKTSSANLSSNMVANSRATECVSAEYKQSNLYMCMSPKKLK